MKRRDFIKIATATAGLSGGLACKTQRPKPSVTNSFRGKDRPNILFIITDQQHAGMLSCTGNPWLQTPTLDRLAASGIRFERAYATNPLCVPNRFSLEMGQMPSVIGISRNDDSRREAVTDAMLQRSLGRLFQNAGYETLYSGKRHMPRGMRDVQDLGYHDLTQNERQGLADACAAFIKGPHKKPFFLLASFINPHDIAYMAIDEYRRFNGEAPIGNEASHTCQAVLDQAHEAGDLRAFVEEHCPPLPANHEVPEAGPGMIKAHYVDAFPVARYIHERWTEEQWRLHRWVYCRLTEKVDQEIGILIDALHKTGMQENTLIVCTSDHGHMDAAHKMAQKSVLYEEAARVPLIMSFQGQMAEGAVDDTHLVSNGLDLLPTLCDYAGVPPPEGLHGRSLRPLTEGKKTPEAWRTFIVSESQKGRMLRTNRFKYSIYESGRHREQLTDLTRDPGEMNNLAEAKAYSDVLDTHRHLLQEWVEKTDDRIAATYLTAPTR